MLAAEAVEYPVPFTENASNGLKVVAAAFPFAVIVPGLTAAVVAEVVD